MITFLIGKRNKPFETQMARVLSGAKDVERKTVTVENIRGIMDDICTPSLFGEKKTFVLSGLRDDDPASAKGSGAAKEEAKQLFFEQGETLSTGSNDVIVILESLLAADVKKAEKFAKVIKVLDGDPKAEKFNPFMLGDAFASGDKKTAWIAFERVVENGDEMEPTHGLVWWKLKDMMAKRSVFSESHLKNMARELVSVYHESRLGGLGMRERLEKFFLTMPPVK